MVLISWFVKAQSQQITQSGNMGRKTQISFNVRKYVEKHCNGLQRMHSKKQNKASYNAHYIVTDLTDFFCNDRKEIKTQIAKKKYL